MMEERERGHELTKGVKQNIDGPSTEVILDKLQNCRAILNKTRKKYRLSYIRTQPLGPE